MSLRHNLFFFFFLFYFNTCFDLPIHVYTVSVDGVQNWSRMIFASFTLRTIHTYIYIIHKTDETHTAHNSGSVGIYTSYIPTCKPSVHRMFLLLHHNVVAVARPYTATRAHTHTTARAHSKWCDSAEDMRVYSFIYKMEMRVYTVCALQYSTRIVCARIPIKKKI